MGLEIFGLAIQMLAHNNREVLEALSKSNQRGSGRPKDLLSFETRLESPLLGHRLSDFVTAVS